MTTNLTSSSPRMVSEVEPLKQLRPVAVPRVLSVLQLGLGWFPEHAGGLERVYHDLIGALPGVDVKCQGLVVGSEAVTESTNGQVTAFARHDDRLMTRLKLARRAVAKAVAPKKTDLVVSHFALYTYPALGKIRKLPLVVHFQGPWAGESLAEGAARAVAFVKRRIERAVYRRADRVIVLSSAFAELVHRDYGVRKDRIRIVPAGIDCDRFDILQSRLQARERLDWPTDRPIVLSVRRLVHRMGLEDLIGAADMVRRVIPNVLIIIAGKGSLRETLEARIARQNLQNNVRLVGFLPDADLPLAYRAADLTIVPSVALEGFGLVAAESLATGTPAMVTPVGGLPDVVHGLSWDLVLPDVGPVALSKGLSAALSGELTIPGSTECRSFARSEYDWSIIARKISTVYQEAIPASAQRANHI